MRCVDSSNISYYVYIAIANVFVYYLFCFSIIFHTENCSEYLVLWLQHVQFLKEFNWVSLDKTPEWSQIDKVARQMVEKGLFEKDQHQQLFHNFGVLEASMNKDQLNDYCERKVSIVDRWVEFFKKCDKENYNCKPLIRIVSYVLTIPGTFLFKMFLRYCTEFCNMN